MAQCLDRSKCDLAVGIVSHTQPITAVTNQDWLVAGVGDFDHDGNADIFWRNERTGANAIWKAGASNAPQATTTVGELRWDVVGVGDFDGDGKSDVLWRNESTGANAIWRSGMSNLQLPVRAVTNTDWHIEGVGDFDGDGSRMCSGAIPAPAQMSYGCLPTFPRQWRLPA